ncbi:MAG TPA: Gfo/Idh/MocA family oxidoreductase [Acidimicrobiia bacterium]|nr:Gfo/Idh/MocA family oxidoreductase [Acidimicrobiia bacterium]
MLRLDTPTRVGIIGVGGIGAAYASAIGQSDSLSLTAVCDRDQDKVRSLAADVEAEPFSDCSELAESGACDIVVVATPPSTHAAVTVTAVEAGLDVLCEKPFALDVATAWEMFDAADRNRRLLAMASKFRYVSDLDAARKLIRSGRIGRPVTVDVTFASHVDMSGRWNSDPAISGGGVLIDNGTHAVDIVRYLVGGIRRVSAMRGITNSRLDVEDTGVMLSETIDGAVATVAVSWAMAPNSPSYVTVHGTDGTIEVGWAGSRSRSGVDGEWVPFGDGYAKLDALRLNVENFAAARLGKEEMRISRADALASVTVIAATYRAINEGAWIEVDEPQITFEVGLRRELVPPLTYQPG